jgi:Uma2 family endonuclease
LWPGKLREPDLVFMAADHENRISEQYWGVPDLVLEVVSPGTRRLDEVTKVKEYAEAGVREYWIVDAESETIALHVLAGRQFELRARAEKGETVRSEILVGFEVSVDDVINAS